MPTTHSFHLFQHVLKKVVQLQKVDVPDVPDVPDIPVILVCCVYWISVWIARNGVYIKRMTSTFH